MKTKALLPTTRRWPRLVAIVISLAVFATACGGGDNSSLVADATSGGASATNSTEFCAGLGAAVGPGVDDELTDENKAIALEGFDAARQALPDNAPPGFDLLLDLMVGAFGAEDPTLGMLEAFAAMDDPARLEAIDSDEVMNFLLTECADTPGIEQLSAAFAGLDVGDSSSEQATSEPGQASEAAPADTTTTTTTIPEFDRERVELAADTGSANYFESAVIVELVEALNHDPEDLDDPLLQEAFFALVSFDVQTEDVGFSLGADNFSLVDPDGRAQAGTQLFGRTGETEFSVRLDSRDAVRFSVAFPLEEQLADLAGWSLWIGGGSTVPEQLPLTEPIEAPYPIDLEAGQTGSAIVASANGSCDAAPFAAEVREAAVTLEQRNFGRLNRAEAENRFVTIFVDFTNNFPGGGSNFCPNSYLTAGYTFALETDGRSLAGDQRDPKFGVHDVGETRELEVNFEIPVDAEVLRLLGEQGEFIAEWNVSLPLVDGR